jgi:hypothetical protein
LIAVKGNVPVQELASNQSSGQGAVTGSDIPAADAPLEGEASTAKNPYGLTPQDWEQVAHYQTEAYQRAGIGMGLPDTTGLPSRVLQQIAAMQKAAPALPPAPLPPPGQRKEPWATQWDPEADRRADHARKKRWNELGKAVAGPIAGGAMEIAERTGANPDDVDRIGQAVAGLEGSVGPALVGPKVSVVPRSSPPGSPVEIRPNSSPVENKSTNSSGNSLQAEGKNVGDTQSSERSNAGHIGSISSGGRSGAGKENPINPEEKDDNCTACVAAFIKNKIEGRTSGNQVTAPDIEKEHGGTGQEASMSEDDSLAYIERATNTTAKKEAMLKEGGAPKGHYVLFTKESDTSGHVMYGEVPENGEPYFYDPQSGGQKMTYDEVRRRGWKPQRTYLLVPNEVKKK